MSLGDPETCQIFYKQAQDRVSLLCTVGITVSVKVESLTNPPRSVEKGMLCPLHFVLLYFIGGMLRDSSWGLSMVVGMEKWLTTYKGSFLPMCSLSDPLVASLVWSYVAF